IERILVLELADQELQEVLPAELLRFAGGLEISGLAGVRAGQQTAQWGGHRLLLLVRRPEGAARTVVGGLLAGPFAGLALLPPLEPFPGRVVVLLLLGRSIGGDGSGRGAGRLNRHARALEPAV